MRRARLERERVRKEQTRRSPAGGHHPPGCCPPRSGFGKAVRGAPGAPIISPGRIDLTALRGSDLSRPRAAIAAVFLPNYGRP